MAVTDLPLQGFYCSKNFPFLFMLLIANSKGSNDFQTNLQQLKNISSEVYFLEASEAFPN